MEGALRDFSLIVPSMQLTMLFQVFVELVMLGIVLLNLLCLLSVPLM